MTRASRSLLQQTGSLCKYSSDIIAGDTLASSQGAGFRILRRFMLSLFCFVIREIAVMIFRCKNETQAMSSYEDKVFDFGKGDGHSNEKKGSLHLVSV